MTMAKTDFYTLKIKALLHDPPEKAPVLMQTRESHEKRSQRYLDMLIGEGEKLKTDEIDSADYIASASDRYQFPSRKNDYRERFLRNPEIRHPLSGAGIEMERMEQMDFDALNRTVENAIRKIAETYLDKDESQRLRKIYLSLWRELPGLLKGEEDEKNRLGELWDLLPADTRIPDHSIWDHRSMVSALAGAGMHHGNAGLLLFTIGPVQEFIAASRKTVDLWSGSYLLAWLSWQAIQSVISELGPDAVIFPNLYGQPLVDLWLKEQGLQYIDQVNPDSPRRATLKLAVPTLPNRFFAVVPIDRASDLAEQARQVIQDELANIGDYVWNTLNSDEKVDSKNLWNQQIQQFLECYWTVLPIKNIKEKESFSQVFDKEYSGLLEWCNPDYKKMLDAYETGQFGINIGTVYGRLYSLVEQSTGARKALRDFRQLEEPGYRDSLIPQLAALVPKAEARPREFRLFWNDLAGKHKKKLSENERLSAISLIKRWFPEYLESRDDIFGNLHKGFPSTHSIAGADYKLAVIEYLRDNQNSGELQTTLEKYIKTVRDYEQFVNTDLEKDYPPDQALYKIRRTAGECEAEENFFGATAFCDIQGEYLFPAGFDLERETEFFRQAKYEGKREEFLEKKREALKALNQLYRTTDSLRIQRPSPYYAVILFDGDHMGKWLSGEKSPDYVDALHSKIRTQVEQYAYSNEQDEENGANHERKAWKTLLKEDKNGKKVKRPLAPAIHAAVSRALNDFALHSVREIVEEDYIGKLVYAGGDDVLALTSIGHALKIAEKLRAAFSGHFNEDGEVDWATGGRGYILNRKGNRKKKFLTMGHTATGSAGIAIVHYMYPLRQALALAREAEHQAKHRLTQHPLTSQSSSFFEANECESSKKDGQGRDAFCIAVAKRSGDTTKVGAHWRFKNEQKSMINLLDQIAQLISSGALSTGFVYEVEKEEGPLRSLEDSEKEHDDGNNSPVPSEIRRLFTRHSEGLAELRVRKIAWMNILKKEEELSGKNKEQENQVRNEIWDTILSPLLQEVNLSQFRQLVSTVQFMIRGGIER